MEKETLDQAHARLGHTAPRITLADLEANILDVEIVKHVAKSGQVLRWAVLTTRSGFAVAGDPSASVSKENDSAELGEKLAIENSRRALWPLMGYALRERLHDTEALRRGGIVDVSQGNTVAGFIGWLSADIPELRNVEVPRLAQSYDRFLDRVREDRSQVERAEAEGMLDRNAFAGMSDAEHGRLGHVWSAELYKWIAPPTGKRGDTVAVKLPAGGVQTDAIYHPGSPGVPPNPVPDPK